MRTDCVIVAYYPTLSLGIVQSATSALKKKLSFVSL